jgi:phosphoribosylformylglycinamidine cyclo-ligase
MSEAPLTYESSGVSIAAQDQAIAAFKDAVTATHGPEVLAGVGAFGAAFAPRLAGLAEPVLISSADSLGSKGILHKRFGTLEWAGHDIVGCVVNDVIVTGARPLFFLDYLGLHKMEPGSVAAVVQGVAAACKEIGCALIGGELAEIGDVYRPGEFDLAGFAVGLVDRSKLLGNERVQPSDALISLASNGVHCNGITLARKALAGLAEEEWLTEAPEMGRSLKDTLLTPARCYANEVGALCDRFTVHAAAHISGGGLVDNIPRIIPPGQQAVVDRSSVDIPPVFAIIQRAGHIPEEEMWHVFNMGVGLVLAVNPETASEVISYCEDLSCQARIIGKVVEATGGPRFRWSE